MVSRQGPVYDDIVVGAGSSGAVLAARLSEDSNRQVLLIEAGMDFDVIQQTKNDADELLDRRRFPVTNRKYDWGFEATPSPGRDAIPLPRGRVVGGCSSVNATIALRGVPADYDEWASLGNPEWAWDKALPFFRMIEDYHGQPNDFTLFFDACTRQGIHGVGGPIPVSHSAPADWSPLQRAFFDACRAAGLPEVIDHNVPDSTGVGPLPMNRRGELRVSTAIGYLLAAAPRPNLSLRTECIVDQLILESTRATGIEIVDSSNVRARFYGRRVTLSAGAIGSPAILMRSGIGDADALRALGIAPAMNLPGVGANLMDHPLLPVPLVPTDRAGDSSQWAAQILVRTTLPQSSEFNDMQFVAGPAGAKLFGLFANLMRPQSRGRLTLQSADPLAPPKVELNLATAPLDMARLVAGVRALWEIAHLPPMKVCQQGVIGLNDDDLASDEKLAAYVTANVDTYSHAAGTARMGSETDSGAVVDQLCRVHGVENLRVVDASVMPAIPRANTNLTCIMLAERAADWMRHEH